MKVIAFGSRTWNDPHIIKQRLGILPAESIVVHGASPGGGADDYIDRFARARGLTVIPVPINEDDRKRARAMSRPRMAPILRNIRMADEHSDANLAIGFWDGRSPGSKNMRGECLRRGIPVEIIGELTIEGDAA